jgi:23S rRNA pseudouridine2457 synthase
MLFAFHKPYGVLSKFTPDPGSPHRTLADFDFPKNTYPIGRLDADSEGLLLLSDEPGLNATLLPPARAHLRRYWVQVERIPTPASLHLLERGVILRGQATLPCRAWLLNPAPVLPARVPPIRFRAHIPDAWLGLELAEGKNRQIRHMTAAIGHPTLRLVRVQIGGYPLAELPPGQWKTLDDGDRGRVLARHPGTSY